MLLIKVTSLYFLPNEKSVPFKLISNIMNQIMPHRCVDKKVSSFGRRIKMLLKNKMNVLFVGNKLELCKQDKELVKKYEIEKKKLKKNQIDQDQVDLYIRFMNDIKERLLKSRAYENGNNNSAQIYDEEESRFELPDTMEEFERKYVVRNSNQNISLFKACDFKQPTTDYAISCHTLHSAIHSSILINDKNPRAYESLKLFDKYSPQLLNDVVTTMSHQHRIIAPTKCSVSFEFV